MKGQYSLTIHLLFIHLKTSRHMCHVMFGEKDGILWKTSFSPYVSCRQAMPRVKPDMLWKLWIAGFYSKSPERLVSLTVTYGGKDPILPSFSISKDVKRETAVRHDVLTFVRVKPLDILNDTLGHFPAVFVTTITGYLSGDLKENPASHNFHNTNRVKFEHICDFQ